MDELSWISEIFDNITEHITIFGWSLMYVGGECTFPGCQGSHKSDLDQLGSPGYGYTIGLPFQFDHPELVLAGLDVERTSDVLNIAAQHVADGARLFAGDMLELEGAFFKVAPCAHSRVQEGLIAMSMDYHQFIDHRPVPNPLQILTPDADGRFPAATSSLGHRRRNRQRPGLHHRRRH